MSEVQLLDLLTDQRFEIQRLGKAITYKNKTIKLQRKQIKELRDSLGVKGRARK